MALLEDIPPEVYTMFIPMMFGVVLVAVTVIAIFWIGAGRQRSFEEAKAQASKRAEEMLKGKEYQNSPRAKKGKRQFPRKPKKADEELSSLSLDDSQPLKGILKPAAAVVKELTPERSPRNRVEFQLDSSIKENKTAPRASPPTPHPGKQPHFKEAMQQVCVYVFACTFVLVCVCLCMHKYMYVKSQYPSISEASSDPPASL